MNDKHKIVILILALIGNFTFLLTAQTATVVKEPSSLPSSCFPLKGKDSMETLRNFATLQESYQFKYFDREAYNAFSYVYRNAPCAYRSLYQMAPKLFEAQITQAKTPELKRLLTDTLLMVLASKYQYFGDEGYPNRGTWAYYTAQYRPERNAEALMLYRQYFTNTEVSDPYYLKDNLKIAITQLNKKQYDKEHLISLYTDLNKICITKILNTTDTTAIRNWKSTQLQMSKMMSPYLKCTDIDKMVNLRLNQYPNNDTIVSEALALYQLANCGSASSTYVKCLEKDYSNSKTSETALLLANYYRKKKNLIQAEKYYLQASEITTKNSDKSSILSTAAEMYIGNKNTIALKYIDNALGLDPNNGRAYYIKGIVLYQMRCGNDFDKAMAACLSVDLFNKAIEVEPSLSKEVQARIAQYKQYYPLKSKAFFYNLKDGDSYTIKCMGQTTTVRTR